MFNKFIKPLVVILLALTLLSACGRKTSGVEPPSAAELESQPQAASSASSSSLSPLPPEPQEVKFQSEDGQELVGWYYPAAINPAPLVVLMHWARGEKCDWEEIAYWLQNRGLSGSSTLLKTQPWLDPDWFPPMPEGKSYGTFAFTFRNCTCVEGYQTFDRKAWLQDALAAMRQARQLEGVDARRILAVGASIGADGAVDACQLINEEFPNTCQGAMPLSPGNYLTLNLATVVNKLNEEEPPKPVWCVYPPGEGDCLKVQSIANVTTIECKHGEHGMLCLQESVEPDILSSLLELISITIDT